MPENSTDQLLKTLARGKPVPAIVLLGSDPYLRELCRNKIIETFVPVAARDWALGRVTVEGTDWAELFQRADTMPMLATCQVLLVDGADSIEIKGKGGAEDDDTGSKEAESAGTSDDRTETLKALAKYLDAPAQFTVLVFEVPRLDRRQRLFKILSEKALIVALELDADAAASLATQIAKDLGALLEPPAASMLVDRVAAEPNRIRMEIDKLASYAGNAGRITCADVEKLVPADRKNTVWQLAEMLATRRRADALEFLNNLLREGEAPAALVGALAWMYRKLIEARDLPAGMNGYSASRTLQMNPAAAEAALANSRKIPKRTLLAGLVALGEADSQLKQSNPDPKAMMEFLVARLTSASDTPSACA
jgi:DNA polymerase III delta subunit